MVRSFAALPWRARAPSADLRSAYFLGVICEADSFWGKLRRRFPETALLALYRAAFFYGTTRWIAWLIWAHVLHSYPFDISWGGPHWVPAETSPNG